MAERYDQTAGQFVCDFISRLPTTDKRERKSRKNVDRVAGKYMYRMTEADVARRLTAEGAREIEKKAMAYLEGNG